MVTPPEPEPENWLLGKWQGPAYGCPPGGGIEFTADHSFTYFKGKITVRLPVSYRVDPNSVTVTTVGPDGIAQDYVYQQTGPDSMIIVGIPPNMPRSLLGAAHRRCDAAPAKKAQQAALQAPVAVYPGVEASLRAATPEVVTPSTAYTQTGAPSASMAPLPPAPKTTTPASATPTPVAPAPSVSAAAGQKATLPVAETQAKPAPAPQDDAKGETAQAESETVSPPKLPKSTIPASVADAQAAREKETQQETPTPSTPSSSTPASNTPAPSTPAENASAENAPAEGLVPVPAATGSATDQSRPAPAAEQQASAAPPAPTETPAPAPALADTTAAAEQRGWDALNAGKPDEALQIWEPLAKSGDTGLAVNVASMYEFGQKLPQDYAKSAEWYRIAADQGDGYAQYVLGRAYTRGIGVPIDRVQAYKWLTLAMQSLSNASSDKAENGKGKTGKAGKIEIETALNDIVGAMSQSDMAKAAQMVKEYDAQHKTAD
jgi:hypothetical protein